jgi:hypothetical protein
MIKLLDLFCGGGGAAMGYYRAGFDVVGIDIKSQPYYPFKFYQSDAIEYLIKYGENFDLIHASPPCQGYSNSTRADSKYVYYSKGKDTPRLIDPLREVLLKIGNPYIIENVRGAKKYLKNPIVLCGSMFNLYISRHRYFETSFNVSQLFHPSCSGIAKINAEKLNFDYRDMTVTGKGRRAGTSERWKILLGINWDMTQANLAESIPPVYTEWIAKQYLLSK